MDQFNYILSGFAHAAGKYEVTNSMLEEAAMKNMLDGFNPELIRHSKNYQAYIKDHPNTSPFDYFMGYKMGFYKRHHVTPWPPIKKNQDVAENSLDLLIEAVDKALENAGVDAEEIDGWIVSTVSPQEQAPGIAATLKCYFTSPDNISPAMTLTSGCAGFNIALKRSLDYFRSRSDTRHILIANTETMSHFLNHKRDFVFHATFGDAAAAAVISQVENNGRHEGVGAIFNHHDLRMIDFVGVDKDWNLYMDGAAVKRRAVPDLVNSSREVMQREGWTIDDIDLVVPHQTGNAILHAVAEALNLPRHKLYQGAQHEYGNVSGTTIPIALSMLRQEGKLHPGMKLLCPTAGVGGEYGAWTYIVPETTQLKRQEPLKPYSLLSDKKIVILYADNVLGVLLAEKLKDTDVQVIFHVNNQNEYTQQLERITANYAQFKIVQHFINCTSDADELAGYTDFRSIDYLMNIGLASEAIYGIGSTEASIQTIQAPFDRLTRTFLLHTKQTILYLGHPMELATLKEVSPVSVVARAWHGLAGSMAGEAISKGVRSVWYIPAIYEALTAYMSGKHKNSALKAMQQSGEWKDIDHLAENLIKSLYLLKVPQTADIYEGPMIKRADACVFRKHS